jgi:hypothetical protein
MQTLTAICFQTRHKLKHTALCADLKAREFFESGAPRRFQKIIWTTQNLNSFCQD